jgi:hypothetical protein
MPREEPLQYLPDQGSITFVVPPVENKAKHNQFIRDLERVQWFSIGNGYTQSPESWVGKFESEEYNCVIRYLNKYGWAESHVCTGCGTTV